MSSTLRCALHQVLRTLKNVVVKVPPFNLWQANYFQILIDHLLCLLHACPMFNCDGWCRWCGLMVYDFSRVSVNRLIWDKCVIDRIRVYLLGLPSRLLQYLTDSACIEFSLKTWCRGMNGRWERRGDISIDNEVLENWFVGKSKNLAFGGVRISYASWDDS